MSDRQELWIEFENHYMWGGDDIRKTLPEAVKWLQDHLDNVPPEFHDSSLFEIEYERGSYDEGDSCTVKIGYHRPETDEEVAQRKAEEAATKARYADEQTARELAAYQALKRKYG